VHKNRREVSHRVSFTRGYPAWIMSIDGTRRLDCDLVEISEAGAQLVVKKSIAGLKEFFLVLSSVGTPAYRRCSLAWVDGESVGVRFTLKSSKNQAEPTEDTSSALKGDARPNSR